MYSTAISAEWGVTPELNVILAAAAASDSWRRLGDEAADEAACAEVDDVELARSLTAVALASGR